MECAATGVTLPQPNTCCN